jgi:hypothetical protein
MTQKELIMEYIDLYGSILPAKMAGKVFKGEMFGSETSKRCRELRRAGKLVSHSEGKFEVFTAKLVATTPELTSFPGGGLYPLVNARMNQLFQLEIRE